MSPASPCFESAIANIAPSPAQEQVATEYCAQCAAAYAETLAQCQAGFFAGGTGNGTVVLAYDDDAASQVGSFCSQNQTQQSCGLYYICTQNEVLVSSGLPSQCIAETPPGN